MSGSPVSIQLSQKSGLVKKKIKQVCSVATTSYSIRVGASRLGVRGFPIGANQRLRKWRLLHTRNNPKNDYRQLNLFSDHTQQVIYLSS